MFISKYCEFNVDFFHDGSIVHCGAEKVTMKKRVLKLFIILGSSAVVILFLRFVSGEDT